MPIPVGSTATQLRSNTKCSNYSQSREHCILLAATLINQQSTQFDEIKDHNI